jgi:DNA-binding transcriptional ArsR family regulator
MLAGTRGGYTYGFILKKLADKPYTTNQLAEALNIDYRTTSHHLDVLANNGIITITNDNMYFLSKDMGANLNDFKQIWAKIERNIKQENLWKGLEYGFKAKNFRGS